MDAPLYNAKLFKIFFSIQWTYRGLLAIVAWNDCHDVKIKGTPH